jgi:hypothetical protein
MLGATQRRWWELVTAPEGVGAASLEGWLVSDARCAALPRLEVYANAYFARLLGVLRDDFGALAAALGDDGMNDVATAYLWACPPRRPSIRHAGAELASFLASHPAAAPFRRRWPWCADLARLETALCDAFDAADAPLLARETLAALAPEAWGTLRLRLAPCVRVLALDWPVLPLRAAFERDEPLPAPPPEPAANAVLVWRRDELVRWRSLAPLESALLESVRAGADFETLCELAARAVGEQRAPAEAAAQLAGWIGSGLLSA